jgi:hypothetical protein
MRGSSLLCGLVLAVAACGGGGDGSVVGPPKKPDPYITVRFQNLIDTTTAAGRANWDIFMDITSADPNLTGFVGAGSTGLDDIRLHHLVHCQSVGADSVGQRFVAFLALADTVSGITPYTTADSVARAWFAGSHTVPTGWMAFYQPPIDAWTSAQYLAGHGLVQDDPIRWSFDWTTSSSASFYERTDSDPACAHFF